MDKIFTTNSTLHSALVSQKVDAKRLMTLLGAADPEMFKPSSRNKKTVGLSMAYYPRKNPQLFAELVIRMPDIQFVLVGKHWYQWQGFNALMACPNLRYVEADYADYPQVYANFDVFLSTSSLEGGPIPLIETMMCNVVPVVSDTGFARDVITDRKNGFVFPVNAAASDVELLIRKALTVDWNVAQSVRHLSWQQMSKQLHRQVSAV